jgi:GNAT superfamily N-acetyltransferase
MNELEITFADTLDASAITGCIRDGVRSEVLPLCIYGCPGIERFVFEQIAVQEFGGDTYYVRAAWNGRFAGCAQMRGVNGRLFLNYIAVLPEMRGRGIGPHLLRQSVLLSPLKKTDWIELDVLENNFGARRWYERLGFVYANSISWNALPLSPGEEDSLELLDFPQAQACQERYGFSQFRVRSDSGEHSIGRLGNDWFRLADTCALHAPGLTALLHRLDSRRKVLVVEKCGNSEPSPGTDSRIAFSFRMEMPIELLVKNLEKQE